MGLSLHPRLINEPLGDPGLFISFLHEKRAMLFDLGDLSTLSSRDILKITHVFVTHTHMDHFIGFDRLLRLCLGRQKRLYLYGPAGFLINVEGKLAGYSWNLVSQYKTGLDLIVTEVHTSHLISKEYKCNNQFIPEKEAKVSTFSGVLLKEPGLVVYATILDHKIPCLGLSIKEQFHVNIMKDRLIQLGLEPGPWLKEFKQALYACQDPMAKIKVNKNEKIVPLKELQENIARISPGQKIAYISDVGFNQVNLKKIIKFAKNADHLFIEAVFLEDLQELAKKKYHLTARQAGIIAGMANVKKITLFHFSPRYQGKENLLHHEAQKAFEDFKNNRKEQNKAKMK